MTRAVPSTSWFIVSHGTSREWHFALKLISRSRHCVEIIISQVQTKKHGKSYHSILGKRRFDLRLYLKWLKESQNRKYHRHYHTSLLVACPYLLWLEEKGLLKDILSKVACTTGNISSTFPLGSSVIIMVSNSTQVCLVASVGSCPAVAVWSIPTGHWHRDHR